MGINDGEVGREATGEGLLHRRGIPKKKCCSLHMLASDVSSAPNACKVLTQLHYVGIRVGTAAANVTKEMGQSGVGHGA